MLAANKPAGGQFSQMAGESVSCVHDGPDGLNENSGHNLHDVQLHPGTRNISQQNSLQILTIFKL